MAEVRPFRGWRYSERAGEPSFLVSPPYDIIPPVEAPRWRQASPYNAVHVELPEGLEEGPENRYAASAARFAGWKSEGVVRQEEQPAFYVYGQQFALPDGQARQRLGVLTALRLKPYEAGVVLPHEQTFPKHKQDRYRLLSEARAQFSPIMGLFDAQGTDAASLLREAAGTPPAMTAESEGVRHSIWPITDTGFLERFAGLLDSRQVFIADGHHRYETALRYQSEQPSDGAAWYDHIMIYLVAMEDPGLALMPTHRMLRGLSAPQVERLPELLRETFTLQEPSSDPNGPVEPGALRLLLPGGRAWELRVREAGTAPAGLSEASAQLEANLLHRLIVDGMLGRPAEMEVTYTRDAGEASALVTSGDYQLAFLLPSPRMEQMRAIALAGETMPQKTTYFWPKAWAGLVFYGEGAV